jgi:BirA family transcriptional regulator, biotin operon repressor / biotin---[acetyl-CoA-carboxylase] ligase
MRSAPLAQRLFATLARADAPRAWHSGAVLARHLGVSRSAVWKAADALRALGLSIDALPRQGYRLHRPAVALDAAVIRAALPAAIAIRLRTGECLWQTGSTNADLLARSPPAPGEFDFLAAEVQREGRGRRGRRWLAAPGSGLCLSWSWGFDALPPRSGCLGLAIGVSAVRALRELGIDGVGIKWPNDLVTPAGKLGGILIEMKSEAGGPIQIVVGIGLNVALGVDVIAQVAASGNRATDLTALGTAPDRNRLAAALLAHGTSALIDFTRAGFAPFEAEYRAADVLAGCGVTVSGARGIADGIARGIDEDGALRVQTTQGLERVLSGDVSVRSL